MDKEYGTMFKRLMHERNELRKYIIDICKLLDIDTRQSVLGANCLEFYAVLSSVANEKIKVLQTQLKRKEQVLDEIKEICNSVENIENINSLYDAKLSGMFLQANKILQKISECEGNND